MKEENGEVIEAKGSSVLVPFLVGGLVGAAIGLLLAPKAGRETRQQIKDLARDTKDRVASTIDKGRTLYDDARVAFNSALEAGKQAYTQERDKLITSD